MLIMEISTQSMDKSLYPETGGRPYLFRDSKDYPRDAWKTILEYLKRNQAAGLLKYKVIEQ